MKHQVFLFAVIMMALAIPQSVKAYDFSAVAPSGQTLYYNISGSNVIVTNGLNNVTGDLAIPSSVTYNGSDYTVTSIGNYAFWLNTGLTSVTIPNSVSSIGALAFFCCSGLTSVTIPNSVASIGDSAFSSCSGLTSVIIPNSVTSIGSSAFSYCSGLTSVTIPNSITSIGLRTFSFCSGLSSVTIPNSVISIGSSAFSFCSSLTSVTIPNSVSWIGDYAFVYCSSLISVTIGNSVTSIGIQAFNGCNNLMEITSLAPIAPALGNDVFFAVSSTIPVYIPCGSMASYQSVWTYFNNLNEQLPFLLEVHSADETMGSASITTMPDCNGNGAVIAATANSGYRFDHWSDNNIDNPRTLNITSDAVIVAYFSPVNGVDEVESINTIIYTSNGQIVVNGSEGNTVWLYDINGRVLATRLDAYNTLHFDVPISGEYLVKIGNQPARKVVVMR